MSPKEIDRLVARYLDGDMSLAEEEEFFVRIALDDELRRCYQAQRIVESALSKGRQSAPRPSHDARRHVVALLGAASSTAAPPHVDARRRWRWGRDLAVVAATAATGAAVYFAVGSIGGGDDRSAVEQSRMAPAAVERAASDSAAVLTRDEPAGSVPATGVGPRSDAGMRVIAEPSEPTERVAGNPDSSVRTSTPTASATDTTTAAGASASTSTSTAPPDDEIHRSAAARSQQATEPQQTAEPQTTQSAQDSVRIPVRVRMGEKPAPREE